MDTPRRERVGVREVALAAGVSLGTVSHYLNTPDRVSEEKRARIQAAIDELGFVRNSAAGQLRNGRNALIGYLAPEISTPYFGVVSEGVERRASEIGYSVLIASSHGDLDREVSYLDMFEQQRVQGILVAARHDIEEKLADIRERGIPSVLVSRQARTTDQPSVTVDDVRGGELVGEHLLRTGRRRIAFIGGPFAIRQVAERFAGLQQAMRSVPTSSIEVIDSPNRSLEDGVRIGRMLADRPASERPDAVFAVNDLLAMGVMQALVSEGSTRVPEDLAVVGYDDVPFAAASVIPLTSVRATRAGYGEAAFDLLFEQMTAGQRPTATSSHLVFQPELFVRASSAPIA
ncbi:LacI family transcriptional regulator [Microbacterium sp. M28]|uniref:LacI family DNA-binding transcriptional regulator n=1 Tax=Microbacterium sp. M28 TaxID=2962064 RepID=UPI0021F4F31A|nr:LacI family DNA-binding transcriptional regulator [Microbacterium sp. M28]UYO97114.1 LacI family transcriptional regulator [Microbacterium sp. M28]